MMDSRLRVGLVGCGNISSEYLRTLSGTSVPVRVTACADRIPARARACAGRFGILALEPEALLASPEVDIVLNLTPPAAHYAVSLAAIRAGKHVYSEKPLAATFEEGKALLEAARQHDVLIGCAPDTFLGQGIQTCRQVIAAGRIGLPVAATAFMVCHGHEDWHPAPDFYYQPGGGPLFDMGPYYLTALVHLLGSLRRVGAFARASFPQRTVASVPGQERILEVAVHTHYAASLEFETGALATLVMSFDVWQANLPHLEIYGSQGSLFCPDPNTFAGPVHLAAAKGDVTAIPLTAEAAVGRGAGLLDMAAYLRHDQRPGAGRHAVHRASGELALHVLEAMSALDESARLGRAVTLTTKGRRP